MQPLCLPATAPLTTEGTLVGHLLRSRNDANLVQRPHIGTQPTMHAQHPPINDLKGACKRERGREMNSAP